MHFSNEYLLSTGHRLKDSNTTDVFGNKHVNIKTYGPAKYLESPGINNQVVSTIINRFPVVDSSIAAQRQSKTSTSRISIPVRTQYPLINWIFPSIGLKVGLFQNSTPYHTLQLARVSNLLFTTLFIALAIALLPVHRYVATFLFLNPIAIFLASSISADAYNIALTSVFVAFIFKLAYNKSDIRKMEYLLLMVLIILLFLSKVAYVPLLLLILALINYSKKNQKKRLIIVSVLGISLGLFLYLMFSINSGMVLGNVNIQDNTSAILQSPVKAFLMIITSLVIIPMQLFNANTFYSVFTLVILVIMYTNWSNSARTNLNLSITSTMMLFRILALIAISGTIILTLLALMVTWTDVQSNHFNLISGFQGRYLMPLLMLIPTLLPNNLDKMPG
jgi:uncharacterized membrane protein